MNDEPETDVMSQFKRQPWTHPDGTVLLPVRKMGCYGCAAGAINEATQRQGSLGRYPCRDMPACNEVVWAPDTPKARAAFIAQRMQA